MANKYNLIKIDDMNFSVRTLIRLKCAKINSFQELLKTDLDSVRNLSKRCKKEVTDKIKEILNEEQ